jgi:hypothetical protein
MANIIIPERGDRSYSHLRHQLDYKVELVAQAFYEAEHSAAFLWDNESALCKERFREFARNAIRLLNEDIGVLLALEQASPGERGAAA